MKINKLFYAFFVFLLIIPFVNPAWVDNEHSVWHNAEDVKVSLTTGSVSLQDWIDQELTNTWVDNEHDVWHNAEDVKVSLTSGSVSLQDWINDQTGGPPTSQDLFFEEGDKISLIEQANNKFLSISSRGNLDLDNGLYANKDSVESNSEVFTIFNEAESKTSIESTDFISLVSLETGNGLKVIDGGLRDGRIHAKSYDEAGLLGDYDEFNPKIVKDSQDQEKKIKCGDVVYFEYGEKFLDINFGKANNPAHLGSKNRFIIYDQSGDCDPNNNIIADVTTLDFEIPEGGYEFKENWDKNCVGDLGYRIRDGPNLILKEEIPTGIIEDTIYDISCSYNGVPNNNFEEKRFLSDSWTTIFEKDERYLIIDAPQYCFVLGIVDKYEGKDKYIFEGKLDNGNLVIRIRRISLEDGQFICPVYKIYKRSAFCGGAAEISELLRPSYGVWKGLECEIREH